MNRYVTALSLSCGLLAPLVAAAQQEDLARQLAKPESQAPMYEDIEIMRRLLHDKLQALYPGAVRLWDTTTGKELGLSTWLERAADLSGLALSSDGKVLARSTDLHGLTTAAFSPDGRRLATVEQAGRQLPFPEGVYLKGRGVVYTLTLPPPGPVAGDAAEPAKPVSDWERLRKEVRGEKPETVKKTQPRKPPGIAEAVLRMLAENGQHFSQLPENESLTVVITFRQAEGGGQARLEDWKRDLAVANAQIEVLRDRGYLAGSLSGNPPAAARDQSTATNREQLLTGKLVFDESSASRDYELLGDLHTKEGRMKEAADAYRKAVEVEKDPQHAAALILKIAGIHLGNKEEAEARKAMDRARELLSSTSKPTPAKPAATPRVPAKLIISASKELLDQVGAGKITFEEFKKAATVDYVPLRPAAKEPSGE